MMKRIMQIAAFLLIFLLFSNSMSAYSVLTHEEIVDLVWTSEIRPLLLSRFPTLTEDELTEAHGYAYGGAVIQDLGYYPFGNREFSDLVHYVRTGDFVAELLRQSQDANEYAFSLGALSHYASDITGHPAVNQAVSLAYPKLRAKYGKSVRYADGKTAHLKTEFGFDMVQIAKNRYASQQYHDFIGFQVSTALLERVFPVVYGVELKDVLTHENLAIGSFRYSVSRVIPQMTQVALQTHKKDLMREIPNFSKKKFLYRLSRSGYEREWGKDYVKPGIGTRMMSTLLRYMPKIGPFKAMAFNSPTAQTEDLYFKSINTTVDRYRVYLGQVRTNSLVLPNLDLDSGSATVESEYIPADDIHQKLLGRLAKANFQSTSPELKREMVNFYATDSSVGKTPLEQAHRNEVQPLLTALQEAAVQEPVRSTTPVVLEAATTAPQRSIVIGFVGGIISHTNMVHSEVQLAAKLRGEYPVGVDVETFESYRGKSALKEVLLLLDTNHDHMLSSKERRNARIIIYGHSWGGTEAIALARDLDAEHVPVLLTIQVDSIAKIDRNDKVIPANVAKAVNFYQPNGLLRGESNIEAADSTRTNIVGNYRLDYANQPYGCLKYPWYDRWLVKAHTQIECDPAVWLQVENLIKAELPETAITANKNPVP